MPFTGDDGIRSPDLEYSGARVLRSCASAYDDTTGDIFEDDDSEDVESETSRAVTGRVRPRAPPKMSPVLRINADAGLDDGHDALIDDLTRLDRKVYAAAVHRLRRDASRVERAYGVRLWCNE